MKHAPGRDEKPVRQDLVRQDLVRQDLDGRYGSIGMPALAAALRYPSDSKNPKYAPAAPKGSGPGQEAA